MKGLPYPIAMLEMFAYREPLRPFNTLLKKGTGAIITVYSFLLKQPYFCFNRWKATMQMWFSIPCSVIICTLRIFSQYNVFFYLPIKKA